MRAVRYHEVGPPEVLKLEDVPAPSPAAGEALLRVEAATVGYAQVLRRSGGHYPGPPVPLPATPGNMAVGVVEAVGPGVDAGLVGKRVTGPTTSGAYAELATAKAAELRVVPKGVSPITAAAIYSEADTAGLAIRAAGRFQPGETVFVPAATGGVGLVAVQLCKLWGAKRVFGAASTEAKRAVVADLGAIPIDYTKEGWSKDVIAQNDGQGVDLAFEVTGGPIFYETIEVAKPGGRVVNYGNVSDTDSPINPRVLLRKNLALIGFFRTVALREHLYDDIRDALLREVDDFLVQGRLTAPIGAAFPLEAAAEAHRALETRSANGKVLVLPNGPVD